MSHVTYFRFLPLRCPLSTKSVDYLSVWGVDGRKVYKTGFPWRKIISLCKSVGDLRPIDILTGEITIEVTGIVGVSLDRIILSFRKRFLSFYIYLLLIWLFMFFFIFLCCFLTTERVYCKIREIATFLEALEFR